MSCTQCVTSAKAGGTVNALTIPPLPCALTTNILILTVQGSNTEDNPTLQMIGYAALPIEDAEGTPIRSGTLPTANGVVLLTSTGNSWRIISNETVYLETGAGLFGSGPVKAIRNSPPVSPSVLDRYLIGTTPTGDWALSANQVAEYFSDGWHFSGPPADGQELRVGSPTVLYRYSAASTAWAAIAPGLLSASGFADLNTAYAAAASDGSALLLDTEAILSADLSLSSSGVVVHGGSINLNGHTLTSTTGAGRIVSDDRQMFTGAGSVVLNGHPHVSPKLFGGVAYAWDFIDDSSGFTDSTAALTKLYSGVQNVKLDGFYLCTQPLTQLQDGQTIGETGRATTGGIIFARNNSWTNNTCFTNYQAFGSYQQVYSTQKNMSFGFDSVAHPELIGAALGTYESMDPPHNVTFVMRNSTFATALKFGASFGSFRGFNVAYGRGCICMDYAVIFAGINNGVTVCEDFNFLMAGDVGHIDPRGNGRGFLLSAGGMNRLINANIETPPSNAGASITASISATTMTVTTLASGRLRNGNTISGTGVTTGTSIVKQLTTSEPDSSWGGQGTYEISVSQTVSATTMTVTSNDAAITLRPTYGTAILENVVITDQLATGNNTVAIELDYSQTGNPRGIILRNVNIGQHTSGTKQFDYILQVRDVSGSIVHRYTQADLVGTTITATNIIIESYDGNELKISGSTSGKSTFKHSMNTGLSIAAAGFFKFVNPPMFKLLDETNYTVATARITIAARDDAFSGDKSSDWTVHIQQAVGGPTVLTQIPDTTPAWTFSIDATSHQLVATNTSGAKLDDVTYEIEWTRDDFVCVTNG